MQIRKILTGFLLVPALVLAGCSSAKTQAVSLNGTNWSLTGLPSGAALSGTTVTLEFKDDRINGSDGCNSYGGSVTLKGDQIKEGNDIVSTMMACADPIMQQASAFYKALKQAATYKVAGQQLTLLDASGKTLATFTRYSGDTSQSPVNTPGDETPPFTAVVATDTVVPTTQASAAPAFAQALPNAAYPLEGTNTGYAQLKDGVFEESIAPGSASKTHVQLTDQQAFGDLNGDGVVDAAVILLVDSGGSGTFSYLSAVLDNQGVAVPVASMFVGDRIVIKSLTIQDGNIVVDLLTRQADQPMSAAPTVEETHTYQLRENQILEVMNQ